MTTTTKPTPIRYTTTGSVRQSCGHAHRSIETAARCLRQDQRDCKKIRGYSDRAIRRLGKNGQYLPLTLEDQDALDAIESQEDR
jgi:hypothetical protein